MLPRTSICTEYRILVREPRLSSRLPEAHVSLGMTFHAYEWLDPRIEIRPSPISGRGLFAVAPIIVGERLIVWGGVVFTRRDVEACKVARGSTVSIGEDLYL